MTTLFPSLAIVRRELLGTARAIKLFVIVCLAIVGGSLLIFAWWPTSEILIIEAGRQTRELTEIVGVVLIVACGLIVPGLAGASIVDEKETRNFDMLYLTMIRPFGLLGAKLINLMGIYLILLVAILPMVGLRYFLVGVGAYKLIVISVIPTLFALSCASLGLAVSSAMKRSIASIIVSYVLMLLATGAPLILLLIAGEALNMPDLDREAEDLFETLSPFGAVVSSEASSSLVWAILYQSLFIFIGQLAAYLKVRKPPGAAVEEDSQPVPDRASLLPMSRRFPFLLIPARGGASRVLSGLAPAVMERELRWSAGSSPSAMARFFVYSSAISIFICGVALGQHLESQSRWGGSDIINQIIFVDVIFMIGVSVIGAALSAGSLTSEKERKNLDMLRTSLLGSRQIVLGKYMAGLAAMSPAIIGLWLPSLGLLYFTEQQDSAAGVALVSLMSIVICAAISLAVGLFASLISSSTRNAILLSVILNALAMGGLTTTLAILDDFNLANISDEEMSLTSPLVAHVENFDLYEQSFQGGEQGPRSVAGAFYFSRMSIFLGVALLLLYVTVRGFDRYLMRARR